MKDKLVAVLTTIQKPKVAVKSLSDKLSSVINAEYVVVGDAKGPFGFELDAEIFSQLKNNWRPVFPGANVAV